MITNIFVIHEKCISNYTRRCIMITNISLYKKMYFSLYKTMYDDNDLAMIIAIHKRIYNDNKYCHYTRRCMTETNILLYKTMCNDNKYFIIQEDV